MATILVADDQPVGRQYLVTLLGYRGHRLLEACDGRQALEIALAEHPDLIITDILMPTMDGYQFVKELRNISALAAIPVIFYTATYHEDKARALAQACGVIRILSKPCAPQLVLEAVDEILGRDDDPTPARLPADFDREHLQLLTNTLSKKVAELENHTKLLQVLSRRLMEAQETERRHIARELHDEIGQNLTLLKIGLNKASRLAENEGRDAQPLKESIAVVEQTLQQVRNLSLDLRPPLLDAAGLESALRWYLDRQSERTGLSIHFNADIDNKRLPSELEIVCYRLVQEALTNILRHAQARRVNVQIWQTSMAVQLVISDDGVGFDVADARERAARGTSLGLTGMQERAHLAGGEVEIVSAPSRGTEVHASFPLPRSGTFCEKSHEPDSSFTS